MTRRPLSAYTKDGFSFLSCKSENTSPSSSAISKDIFSRGFESTVRAECYNLTIRIQRQASDVYLVDYVLNIVVAMHEAKQCI
jgi:hypothetical protein